MVTATLGELTYVAVDVETTGLDPETDRVVEIGAVRFRMDGTVLGRFSMLVYPGVPVPPEATAVHHITDAMLKAAPPAWAALHALNLFLLPVMFDMVLLAHNAEFDVSFLAAEGQRSGQIGLRRYEVLDTLELARAHYPGMVNHKLGTLAAALGLPAAGEQHRALGDAATAMHLLLRILACYKPDDHLVDVAGARLIPLRLEAVVIKRR